MVPLHVVRRMSNSDATGVVKDSVLGMRKSVNEMDRWAASRFIFTVCTLTRAAVVIAHQSAHTLAQSRQQTLR